MGKYSVLVLIALKAWSINLLGIYSTCKISGPIPNLQNQKFWGRDPALRVEQAMWVTIAHTQVPEAPFQSKPLPLLTAQQPPKWSTCIHPCSSNLHSPHSHIPTGPKTLQQLPLHLECTPHSLPYLMQPSAYRFGRSLR